MKVTLLGHATVVVKTGPMRIVMDPVLQDLFENGMVVSCPKRVEAISLPDLLMHFTIYEAADSEDAATRRIDHEISQLREVRG